VSACLGWTVVQTAAVSGWVQPNQRTGLHGSPDLPAGRRTSAVSVSAQSASAGDHRRTTDSMPLVASTGSVGCPCTQFTTSLSAASVATTSSVTCARPRRAAPHYSPHMHHPRWRMCGRFRKVMKRGTEVQAASRCCAKTDGLCKDIYALDSSVQQRDFWTSRDLEATSVDAAVQGPGTGRAPRLVAVFTGPCVAACREGGPNKPRTAS